MTKPRWPHRSSRPSCRPPGRPHARGTTPRCAPRRAPAERGPWPSRHPRRQISATASASAGELGGPRPWGGRRARGSRLGLGLVRGQQRGEVVDRRGDVLLRTFGWPSTTTSASVVAGPVALWALCRQHQRRAQTTPFSSTKTTSPGSGEVTLVEPRSVKALVPRGEANGDRARDPRPVDHRDRHGVADGDEVTEINEVPTRGCRRAWRAGGGAPRRRFGSASARRRSG